MPDIPHEHVLAIADETTYCDTTRCINAARDAAVAILTSTDPAVLDALTDALVRAGRLRKEESEYCTCGHYLTYHSGDGCWFTTTFTQRCACTLMRPQNYRLVTGWREGT